MRLHHLFTYDYSPGKVYMVPECPYSVLWDICYRCNQRCRFCYNSLDSFSSKMPPEDVTLNIAAKLVSWGVHEVILLGGEPCLHPALKRIITILSAGKLDIRIISNGSGVTRELAEFFEKNMVETGISLHGTDSKIHNYLTQNNDSFENAMKAIANLSIAGAKWYIQFTPTTLTNTLALSALLLKRQFPQLRLIDINRLMPHGIGASQADTLYLSSQEWWNCLRQIPEVKRMGIDVSVESVPHCWILEKAGNEKVTSEDANAIISSIRPCYMGINQIALDDNGRMKLCPGGLGFSESILDIEPGFLWRNSPVLKQRREFAFLPSKCLNYHEKTACPLFYNCGGGCKMTSANCRPDYWEADNLICT